jgi:hypothetical protein
MSSYLKELVWSSPVSEMEEQQILRMSSYLNEPFWSSPVSGMEEQQIFRWSRIEESSSPSQVYKLIPEGVGFVLPCLRNGGATNIQVVQDGGVLLTEPEKIHPAHLALHLHQNK